MPDLVAVIAQAFAEDAAGPGALPIHEDRRLARIAAGVVQAEIDSLANEVTTLTGMIQGISRSYFSPSRAALGDASHALAHEITRATTYAGARP